MRYWDSTGLLQLVVPEDASAELVVLLEEDPAIATWWGSLTECRAALARLRRSGRLAADEGTLAERRLGHLVAGWVEVTPSEAVRQQAERVLRLHPLRTAEAMHLAAALVVAEHQPRGWGFVTLDPRLADAADREGFRVLTG